MRTTWSTSGRRLRRSATRSLIDGISAGCALEREGARGLPAGVGVVHVEGEVGDLELALEVGELGERPVEEGVLEVVRDGHVRVVRVLELQVEGAAAYGAGELL